MNKLLLIIINITLGAGVPFSESKIVDPVTKQVVPLNTAGELCIRGPHIMREYWDEKKKTDETIDKNGWLGK